MHPKRAIFFQVRSNLEKVRMICETAKSHFEKKDPLLILVEDEKAKTYVDELLWKFPEESFLPHSTADEPTQDLIVITKTKKNLNQAKAFFNLCSTPLLFEELSLLYEFEDLTNPSKNKLSALRFDAYKKRGLAIESKPVTP